MTAFDRSGQFDRRIVEALEEIAMPNPPEYLDDVLLRTARTAQRSPQFVVRRFRAVSRFSIAAAWATVAVTIVGGVLLFGRATPPGAGASPTPDQTPRALSTPGSLTEEPSPTPSATGPLLPRGLRSTWVANAGPAASPGGTPSLVRLVVSESGDRLSILEAGVETFVSRAANEVTSELDLVSTSTAGGCQVGDLGRYSFAFGTDGAIPGSDGTLLAVTPIEDSCAARATALGRGWVHAIDAASNGGRGIATSSNPMFLITLPRAESNVVDPGPDVLKLYQPDRSLDVVRNPLGYVVPNCSLTGDQQPIDPTIAAWTGYLRTFPGFTVETLPLRVDGHPAMIETISTVQTADCPFHRVKVWFTADGTNFGWDVQQGNTFVLGLVEVDGSLFLFQWNPMQAGEQAVVTRDQLQALLATVRFTDSLPQ